MWNPIRKLRQHQARVRYVPRQPASRAGRTAKIAVVALVLIFGVAAFLEMRGGGAAEEVLIPYAQQNHQAPADLIATAGRRHRLIFLGDVMGASAPKRLAAEAIEALVEGSGLDAVVVEVPADEQVYLDRYFVTTPEDPSILLGRPAILREQEGTSRDVLELYRTIWELNQRLGADRHIRVIAADSPEWSTRQPLSPHEAARVFGTRDEYMAARTDSLLLSTNSRARVLFFVDALHVLNGGAAVQAGGTSLIELTWLAQRLRTRFPTDVYSVITDASAARVVAPAVVAFRSTGAYELFRGGVSDVPSRFALPAAAAFDVVEPINVVVTPGSTFQLLPASAELGSLVDGYIMLGS